MSTGANRFVWYELMTTEPAAAAAYYGEVIGWQARDAGMPGMSYTLLSAGGVDVGGVMALPEAARQAGARPGWNGYVGVADADAAARRFAEAGGTVHLGVQEIPGVGRFAMVADPQGVILALFEPAAAGEAPPAMPPGSRGHAGWHELMATDDAAAFAFYAGQFGWTEDQVMDMGEMGLYRLFAADGAVIGGMMRKPAQVPAPFWLYYFNVEAIDAATARAAEGGGQLVNGPLEVPGGQWIAQCLDPQGATFAMLAPTR